MDRLVPAFQATLFDPALGSLCADMAELGIDGLLEGSVMGDIPIVGLLVGVGKLAQNVRDRNLLRQTLKFINTFNEKTVTPEKKEAYQRRLLDDPKFAEEELGRVLILLDANVELKKSELLARFYRAYIEERIDWERFCELSDVTARLFTSDLELLDAVRSGGVSDTTQCASYQADRLIALGLVDATVRSLVISGQGEGKTVRNIGLSELGEIFCELGKGAG